MRILIVEDDKAVAELIRRVLRPLDAETYLAYDWAGLERALKLFEFDAICLDLGLPDSRTHETLSKIKSLKMSHSRTAIMVITGQPMLTRLQAEEAGADSFLRKEEALERGTLIRSISAVIARVVRPNAQLEHQMELARQATEHVVQGMKE